MAADSLTIDVDRSTRLYWISSLCKSD